MNSRPFAELSDTKLVKRRNMLKGFLIGITFAYCCVIILVIYILMVKGINKGSIASFIPLVAVPLTLIAPYQSLTRLNQEIKFRQMS